MGCYIQILTIPVLMLGAYYLSTYVQRLRLEAYSKHVVLEVCDLNPIQKQNISEDKSVKSKIFLSASVLTFGLTFLYYDRGASNTFKLVYGLALTISTIMFAQQACTIPIFRSVRNNPDEMKGQITQSAKYSFTLNGWRYFESAIVIIPLAILSRSFYVYGALIGSTLMAALNILLYRKYIKNHPGTSDTAARGRKFIFSLDNAVMFVAILYLVFHFG